MAAALALAYLVERTSDVDGAVLDDLVHHLGDGLREVRVSKLKENTEKPSSGTWRQEVAASATGSRPHLGVEEDLGAEEALVANVDGELLLGDAVDARVLFDPLGAVGVVLVELLDQVGTHVAEALLRNRK